MEKSVLFNLYANMCVYFIKSKHLEEARNCVKDMEGLKMSTSLLNFRKAQVLLADARSNLECLGPSFVVLTAFVILNRVIWPDIPWFFITICQIF